MTTDFVRVAAGKLAVPITALQHFTEDIARAVAILAYADPLPRTNAEEQRLRSDLLRGAWMFAVGAMDAYFCDACTDVVAATASSKSRQPSITLPDSAYDIKIPIRAVLEQYDNANWRWRMAARKMMERENVLDRHDRRSTETRTKHALAKLLLIP